ncbi:MAG: hypothetical protein AB1393_08875 [Candidatus Edwardsbacteria bacterium]
MASSIWTLAERNKKGNLNINGIRQFWDGIKLEGTLNDRQFWVEINYATENIIMLNINSKKQIFESKRSQEQFESEIQNTLEQFIVKLENRQLIKNP